MPYFTMLSKYCIYLGHTYHLISNHHMSTQVLTSLPMQYAMILQVVMNQRLSPICQEAIHDLLQEVTTASLIKALRDASLGSALFTQHGSYLARVKARSGKCSGYSECSGHGGLGKYGGNGEFRRSSRSSGYGGCSVHGESIQSTDGNGNGKQRKYTLCNIDSHTSNT